MKELVCKDMRNRVQRYAEWGVTVCRIGYEDMAVSRTELMDEQGGFGDTDRTLHIEDYQYLQFHLPHTSFLSSHHNFQAG